MGWVKVSKCIIISDFDSIFRSQEDRPRRTVVIVIVVIIGVVIMFFMPMFMI